MRLKELAKRIPGVSAVYRHGRILTGAIHEGWLSDRPRLYDEMLRGDAWDFEKPSCRERYDRVLALVESTAGHPDWGEVLEIGCGTGAFSARLAPHCRALKAVDISQVACDLSAKRCAEFPQVRTGLLDLKRDPIENRFDVVFVMDVLDCIHGRRAGTARKLIGAVHAGGLLTITMTRLPDHMRDCWWARWLIEGGDRMVEFLARQPSLSLVEQQLDPKYLIAIFRKDDSNDGRAGA